MCGVAAEGFKSLRPIPFMTANHIRYRLQFGRFTMGSFTCPLSVGYSALVDWRSLGCSLEYNNEFNDCIESFDLAELDI
jgi:hypothetical protein